MLQTLWTRYHAVIRYSPADDSLTARAMWDRQMEGQTDGQIAAVLNVGWSDKVRHYTCSPFSPFVPFRPRFPRRPCTTTRSISAYSSACKIRVFCDESVCVSVCLSTYLWNQKCKRRIFRVHCLMWLWLDHLDDLETVNSDFVASKHCETNRMTHVPPLPPLNRHTQYTFPRRSAYTVTPTRQKQFWPEFKL